MVITGLIVSGRVGAGIGAELGSMRVHIPVVILHVCRVEFMQAMNKRLEHAGVVMINNGNLRQRFSF